MKRKTTALVLIGVLTLVSPAMAGNGTLGMKPTGDWAVPLSDAELGWMRGGFFGIAFSVFFQGFFDNLGNVAGRLTVNTGGASTSTDGTTTSANGTSTPTPTPNFSAENEQVRISTAVGGFNGSSGIFQLTQVPGSFNTIHNNLFVQIVVINALNAAAIPNLSSMLHPF